jgi:archaellum biogenesis protein FlaJ (TadC family)
MVFRSAPVGHLFCMVVTALVLIGLGITFGLFFPVMFVAALAGVVLLVLGVIAGARRAKEEAEVPSSGVDTLK